MSQLSPATNLPIDPPTKHSALGITSNIIAAFCAVAVVVLKILAGRYQSDTPGNLSTETPEMLLIAVLFLGVMSLCFLGAVFGMGGIFERNRKLKVAVVGIVLNIVIVFVCILFLLIQGTPDGS